ncbi:hypothetical protein P7C70_g3471, partial [Phenoliferia sp. Uapishka_3]
MDTSTSDSSASLSHLSSQLLSQGYTSRPLDLVSLFTTPPPPSSLRTTDPQSYAALVSRLRQESTARDQVVKCLWNMLGERINSVERLEEVRGRVGVVEYELERERARVRGVEKKREKARKEAEGERAKTKAALQELTLEQDRHRRSKEDLSKSRIALQLVRTQAVHDIKRRETELLAITTRLQRLTSTSTLPFSTRLTILNSTIPLSSSLPAPDQFSRSTSISRRQKTSNTLSSSIESPGDRSSEIAFLEEALENCEKERKEGVEENRVLRECLGEVGEWCGGVIGGVEGFERKERGEGEDDEGDMWDADDTLLIPHPQFARPAQTFAPTLHAALHHIRTRILTTVERTGEEVQASKLALEEELEEEKRRRGEEEERRMEAERELEEAKNVIEQGEKLVSDFASERFLAGVGGGGGAGEQAQMYDDESRDDILPPTPTLPTLESSEAAAKLAKERAKLAVRRVLSLLTSLQSSKADTLFIHLQSDRAEKKRRRAVAAMLGELELPPSDEEAEGDAPPPAKISKTSHHPNSSSSSAPLPPLREEVDEDRPSPFLARTVVAPKQIDEQKRTNRGALAKILSMAEDDEEPTTSTSTSSRIPPPPPPAQKPKAKVERAYTVPVGKPAISARGKEGGMVSSTSSRKVSSTQPTVDVRGKGREKTGVVGTGGAAKGVERPVAVGEKERTSLKRERHEDGAGGVKLKRRVLGGEEKVGVSVGGREKENEGETRERRRV